VDAYSSFLGSPPPPLAITAVFFFKCVCRRAQITMKIIVGKTKIKITFERGNQFQNICGKMRVKRTCGENCNSKQNCKTATIKIRCDNMYIHLSKNGKLIELTVDLDIWGGYN